jgi:hypothetical protein
MGAPQQVLGILTPESLPEPLAAKTEFRPRPYQHGPLPYSGAYYLPSIRIETDWRPRLSGEEVEKLEAEFQENNKPSSTRKKIIAAEFGVDVSRINVCNRDLVLRMRYIWNWC